MNKIYFILGEMTHLRYFIPLVKENSKRKISSCFLIYFSGKYNCPSKHKDELNNICAQYNIKKTPADEFREKNKTIVCVEKACSVVIETQGVPRENDFYVLAAMFDYIHNYDLYSKYAKNIIFPSQWFLDHCRLFIGDKRIRTTSWSEEKINSPKNVCLGSPKYDIELDKEKTLNKYRLTNKKKVLFLFPSVPFRDQFWRTQERRGLSEKQIRDTYSAIRSLGFEVLVKSREKHPITKNCSGDHDFYDRSWFPHTTMELMKVSDLVIMVGSTSIKECVLQKIPFINIGLMNEKALVTAENFLYPLLQYKYCQNYDSFPDISELKNKIKHLTSHQFLGEFKKATETYLFQGEGTSERIVNFVNK